MQPNPAWSAAAGQRAPVGHRGRRQLKRCKRYVLLPVLQSLLHHCCNVRGELIQQPVCALNSSLSPILSIQKEILFNAS